MTDERGSIRQNSGNLEKFQAAMSKLTNVTVKVGIHEAFVEGRLGTILRGRHMIFISSEVTRGSSHETSGFSNALASAFKELARG
jgi:hypothetical protein